MPRSTTPRPEGAHGHEPAGALRASSPDVGRDADGHPEYGEDGLYVHGPQRARPSLVRLIAPNGFTPGAPLPAVARAAQDNALARRRRLLGAIGGQRTVNRPSRRGTAA